MSLGSTDWLDFAGLIAGGGAGAGITSWAHRRQNRAQTILVESQAGTSTAEQAKILAEAAAILVAPLQGQIRDLEARVELLEEENASLRRELEAHDNT